MQGHEIVLTESNYRSFSGEDEDDSLFKFREWSSERIWVVGLLGPPLPTATLWNGYGIMAALNFSNILDEQFLFELAALRWENERSLYWHQRALLPDGARPPYSDSYTPNLIGNHNPFGLYHLWLDRSGDHQFSLSLEKGIATVIWSSGIGTSCQIPEEISQII